MQRAARLVNSFTFGDDDDEPEGAPSTSDEKKEEDPIGDVVKDLKKHLLDKVKTDIRKDLSGDKGTDLLNLDPAHEEQTLVKEACQNPRWMKLAKSVTSRIKDRALARKVFVGVLLHNRNGWSALQSRGYTGREILAVSRFVELQHGFERAGSAGIYRAVVAVGGFKPYGDADSYLAACRRVLGRDLSPGEVDALVTKGKLFDLAG